MSPLETGGLTLFILVLLFGVISILFGLPGTAIILVDAGLFAALTGFERIGIKILAVLLILSLLAELVDFAVGMAGAQRPRVSQQGFWAFFFGGLIGALLLAPVLLGLGVILGTFIGGLVAMLALELLHRSHLKPSFRSPLGALLGQTAGICVKGFFAFIMVFITLTSVYS